jgi:hypothetical protein
MKTKMKANVQQTCMKANVQQTCSTGISNDWTAFRR